MKLSTRRFAAVIAATVIATAMVGSGKAADAIPISKISHIHGIAVDPTDPSRIYLATHHGLFLTSPNGTATQVSDIASDYMGFTPHPSDPSILFASGHPSNGGNMGVIVSRDHGKSWQQLSQGVNGPVDFHAMTASAADPNVLYGLFGDIQVSRDGGKTWEIAGSPSSDVFDLSASAVDPNLLYAATRSGLMISRDAGKSWEPTGYQGQPATMVQTAPNGTVFAFVVGTGLIKSPGAALSWTVVGADLEGIVLLHLAIDPNDPNRMFAVTQNSQVLASTDGGKTWASFSGS